MFDHQSQLAALHERERAASLAVKTLKRNLDVLAVLLVGSVSCGWATKDSDVDLLVLVPGVAEYDDHVFNHGTVRVVCQLLGMDYIQRFLEVRDLDLGQLKQAGRIGMSRILLDRSGTGTVLRQRARSARLRREDAQGMLARCQSLLRSAKRNKTQPVLARLACRELADVLAVLRLCYVPWRFQKPKWTVMSLRRWAPQSLYKWFMQTHDLNSITGAKSKETVLKATQLIDLLIGRLDRPSGVRAIRRLRWMANTGIEEAKGLLAARLFSSAIYTARFSAQFALASTLGDHVSGYTSSFKALSANARGLSQNDFVRLLGCNESSEARSEILTQLAQCGEQLEYMLRYIDARYLSEPQSPVFP